MTDLAAGFVRARSKKSGAAVVLHRRDLTDVYDVVDVGPADAPAPPSGAAVRTLEDASVKSDNERAAAAKFASDARAVAEAASLAKRDAAAQAAHDQEEADAAAAAAAVAVTDKNAAAKKAAVVKPVAK